MRIKSFLGASDPFVKFRVLSHADYLTHLNNKLTGNEGSSSYENLKISDTVTVEMKAKSKVVRKTTNPVWNETLSIQMPNTPKGYYLLVVLLDYNRIGKSIRLIQSKIPTYSN